MKTLIPAIVVASMFIFQANADVHEPAEILDEHYLTGKCMKGRWNFWDWLHCKTQH